NPDLRLDFDAGNTTKAPDRFFQKNGQSVGESGRVSRMYRGGRHGARDGSRSTIGQAPGDTSLEGGRPTSRWSLSRQASPSPARYRPNGCFARLDERFHNMVSYGLPQI